MSADVPPSGDTGPAIEVADEDTQQTVFTVEAAGVHAVVAVNHYAEEAAVRQLAEELADDLLAEARRLAHLNSATLQYGRGDER